MNQGTPPGEPKREAVTPSSRLAPSTDNGQRTTDNGQRTKGQRTKGSSQVLLLGVFAAAAALGIHAHALVWPMLFYDDFSVLLGSWTWPAAWANLWVPWNEHTMPLGRLSIAAMVQLASGRLTALPQVTSLQGPLAVVAGMGLVYLFVRRELGHPFYGLVAMALFGVGSQYHEAVHWFTASFVLLALDTLLLGLLAAQRWRQTGRWPYLAASALWAALAPAWFAGGILAGPFCALYLVLGQGKRKKEKGKREDQQAGPAKAPFFGLLPFAFCLLPLSGSAAFLAVSLPHNAERILHTEHYQGKTAVEAFDATVGLRYTCRSLMDHLVLGAVGVVDYRVLTGLGLPWGPLPWPLVVPGLALVAVAAAWWWWRAPRRGLLLVGLGFILVNYVLIYSARSGWTYEQMYHWSRYHLLPQLGLVLFLCGGLPRWQGRWFHLDPAGRLSRRQVWALGLLTAGLFVLHLPRSVAGGYHDPNQLAVLRHIEAVDARCREHHIAAATARAVLGRLDVPCMSRGDNGWDFLRGSATPRPIRHAEARRLLQAPSPE
jgi:hypothetical protein